MKMLLTRIGLGSRAVIAGDMTQIDLPAHITSGMVDALRLLEGVDGLAFTHLASTDVMRHPIVQKIIDAYDLAD